ncbi:MAG: hypothetical protein JXO72_06555 [Vicinamibacteria bacterium]|nr:hypothetical protein [Vicinamibacteria bacterium]
MTDRASITERLVIEYGLAVRPQWSADLERAVNELARESGMGSRDVEALALKNPGLLRVLAGKLTIDESHFFRHPEQFEILKRHVTPRLDAGQVVTIWSAGCSRGEEPYSIVMSLIDQCGTTALDRLTILASDLSPEAIALATAGVYHPWSGRGLSEARSVRFFRRREGGEIEVSEDIRSRVRFLALSTQEHVRSIPPGSIDAIFFRNVAIYLKSAAFLVLLEQLTLTLRDDGLLFMAPSDPRPPGDLFEASDPESAAVYRKHKRAVIARRRVSQDPSIENVAACEREEAACRAGSQRRQARPDESSRGSAAHTDTESLTPARRDAHDQSGLVNELARAVLRDPDDLIARFNYAQALSRCGARRRALFHANQIIARRRSYVDERRQDDGGWPAPNDV